MTSGVRRRGSEQQRQTGKAVATKLRKRSNRLIKTWISIRSTRRTPRKSSSFRVMLRRFASTNRHCLRTGRSSYAFKLPFVRSHLSSLVPNVSVPFLKLNISTFFRDMFTLPTTGTAIDEHIGSLFASEGSSMASSQANSILPSFQLRV